MNPVFFVKHMVLVEPLWGVKLLQVQIYWATHSNSGEVLCKILVPNEYRNIFMAWGKTLRYGKNLRYRDNPEPVILISEMKKMGVKRLDVCGHKYFYLCLR